MGIVSDRGPQFISQVWKAYCQAVGELVSLSLGFDLQTNGQMKSANQDLESMLRYCQRHCLLVHSSCLGIEYAHNSLVSSTTGKSPFMVTNDFEPPFFPELETKVVVPSIQEHLCHCSRFWQAARSTLLHSAEPTTGGRTLPTPNYQPGQKVWLSLWNFPLQTDFRKLAPRSI